MKLASSRSASMRTTPRSAPPSPSSGRSLHSSTSSSSSRSTRARQSCRPTFVCARSAAARAPAGRCASSPRWRASGRPRVVAHMAPIYAVLAAVVTKPRRVPLLLWFTHWRGSRLLRLAERLSTRVLSVDRRSFPLRSEKLVAVGHGITVGPPVPKRPDDGVLRLLAVGRTSPAKGLEALAAGSRTCTGCGARGGRPIADRRGAPSSGRASVARRPGRGAGAARADRRGVRSGRRARQQHARGRARQGRLRGCRGRSCRFSLRARDSMRSWAASNRRSDSIRTIRRRSLPASPRSRRWAGTVGMKSAPSFARV